MKLPDPVYYSERNPSEMTLRDHLARDRTVLANERTLLAYIRTAIALFAASGTLLHFFPESQPLKALGIVLLVLGVAVVGIGLWRFAAVARRMRRLRLPDEERPTEAQQQR